MSYSASVFGILVFPGLPFQLNLEGRCPPRYLILPNLSAALHISFSLWAVFILFCQMCHDVVLLIISTTAIHTHVDEYGLSLSRGLHICPPASIRVKTTQLSGLTPSDPSLDTQISYGVNDDYISTFS